VPVSSAAGDAAHLRLSIATTSDWTKVLFDGPVGGVRVISAPTNVNVTPQPNGVWLAWVPPGGATVVLDLALQRTGADTSTIEVQKGWVGVTTVAIENRSAAPTAVATITNDGHALDDPNNVLRQSVASSTLFSAVTPLVRTGESPRVLAFYYPWFDSYGSPSLSDRPTDPRSVESVDGVTSMLSQAKANGIDGFIQSWAGAAHDGQELDVLLQAAGRTGATVSLYLETVSANLLRSSLLPPDGATVAKWLLEGLDQAASNPGFLRDASGVPVVFVYEMDLLSPGAWAGILAAVGRPVRLVGDAPQRSYEDVEWGVHRYNPNVDGGRVTSPAELAAWDSGTAFETRAAAITSPSTAPRLFAATVSPGFDNRASGGATYVDRGAAGERYEATWDAAVGASPEWILVTSWNEWYEATAVEPSQRFGDLALRQTAQRSSAWRASVS
jgi:hypothetical protein